MQSGQKYWVYVNFVDLNAHSKQVHGSMPNQQDILDSCSGGHVFCVLDLKSDYLNIPVASTTMPYLGVTTQDGLYRYRKVPLGLLAAPMYFQHFMVLVCDIYPGVRAYLDNLKMQGEHWHSCWHRTLEVLEALTNAGFMVNLRKCKLLVRIVELLGHLVCCTTMMLNNKCIKTWLSL